MLLRLILSSAFIILAAVPALAEECIYVSTGSGHEILCVHPATGAVTLKVPSQGTSFNPRDLVVGPDGNVYIADSDGDILRFNPTAATPETPYLVAKLPTGAGSPEGLSFSGSDNLYVNTRGGNPAGVWKVPNAANPSQSLLITPVNVISATGGGGIDFGVPGNLLFVNQPQNRVLSSNPAASGEPYTSASALITNNPIGPGVGVNACGDILVASGTAIKRFNAAGQFQNNYVSFSSNNDIVRYFEVKSDNTAFAVTAKDDAGSSGKVWKIEPVVPSGGEAISSCTSGTATLLVELKDVSTGRNPVAATDQGIGLAIPPSNVSLTRSFGAGPNGVCNNGGDDIIGPATNIFHFGHHSFLVSFRNILRCFSITMSAVMSKPSEVDSDDFASGVFAQGTHGMRYSSKDGFVVEYEVTAPPQVNVDYTIPANDSAYKVKIGYFTIEQFQSPGLAKGPNIGNYTEDITTDFWPSGIPGADPEDGGEADTWSGFVVTNTPLELGAQCGTFILKNPVLTGNPQFNKNSTIDVKFECSNGSVPGLQARLSIARINLNPPPFIFETQTVVSKNNQQVHNIFSSGSGNQYTYNVDASALTPGTLQFTIFSNAFSPKSFIVTVK
jgi:hypothetical protein